VSRLTEQQHATRLEGLGGSEALAYCGKDPRCSPLQLYLRKLGEAGERPEEDARQNWGHRLEPVVREWLAEQLGRPVSVPTMTLHSEQFPFMFGNLDGMVDAPSGVDGYEGVEIKTGDKFTAAEFGEVGTDEVPIRYVLQVTHYMVVTGYRRFHLGALLGGNDARHYVIDFDSDLAQMLIARARAFWSHVESRDPPPVQTLHDADKRWPVSSAKAVQASTTIVLAIEELKRLREQERAASEKADGAELTLKSFMGDADALTDAQGKTLASWRSQSRKALDTKALTEAHPELAAQYQRISNYRVFRVR
jgi:putative phage-type endonuclease